MKKKPAKWPLKVLSKKAILHLACFDKNILYKAKTAKKENRQKQEKLDI